ncbi:MAG: DNA-binding protein [Flavobacterium sp. BFFFF2]|nr:MAG: DNA-binding protein [Flavobacterium sp. BFFFF2]
MESITAVQVQGVNVETLFKRFDILESQIRELKQQQNPQKDVLISRLDVSKLLGVSLVTVHNWTKSGVLKSYRVGNKVRFKENEVLASLKAINSKD